MLYPPSLPPIVHSRAFHAKNGELGVMPRDAMAFLDACQADRIDVLGWELWLVDHDWNTGSNEPAPAKGYWCGLIPLRGNRVPGVVHGSGALGITRQELTDLDLGALVEPRWSDYIRINFTLCT